MCVHVCMCACVCACVYSMCVCACMCACMCGVCAHVYICVCGVCACTCVLCVHMCACILNMCMKGKPFICSCTSARLQFKAASLRDCTETDATAHCVYLSTIILKCNDSFYLS